MKQQSLILLFVFSILSISFIGAQESRNPETKQNFNNNYRDKTESILEKFDYSKLRLDLSKLKHDEQNYFSIQIIDNDDENDYFNYQRIIYSLIYGTEYGLIYF